MVHGVVLSLLLTELFIFSRDCACQSIGGYRCHSARWCCLSHASIHGIVNAKPDKSGVCCFLSA